MDIETRMLAARLAIKMEKNKEMSEKMGIVDRSRFIEGGSEENVDSNIHYCSDVPGV